jgi:hypothetical protein
MVDFVPGSMTTDGLLKTDMLDSQARQSGYAGLSQHEVRSVEIMRQFEQGGFDFLGVLQEDIPVPGKTPAGAGTPAASPVPAVPREAVFEELNYIQVKRAAAPDGFRDEDRRALQRFRSYVGRDQDQILPCRARWIEPLDQI